MNLRHTALCIITAFCVATLSVSAEEMWDPEGTLVTRIVQQTGVSHSCVSATLADQTNMTLTRLPQHLRDSCTDEEIVALVHSCVATSVDSVECTIGIRLHVSVTNEGAVNDIYLVDNKTGKFISTGRVRN